MTVIQFPPANWPLDFDGMGIKIDIKKQGESWDAAFMIVQFALRFCNMDYVEAGKTVRTFEADELDALRSDWTETVEYLESIVAIMKAALARLEASEGRAVDA